MDAKLEACLERQIAEMQEWYLGDKLTSLENRKKLAGNITELKEIVDGLEDGSYDKSEGEYAIEKLQHLLEKNRPKQGYPRCPKCGMVMDVLPSSGPPIAHCWNGCGTFIPNIEMLRHEATRMQKDGE